MAIVNSALQHGENKNELYNEMQRVGEVPFDSNRKMMTTIHKVDNKYRIITKGAPDVLLSRCDKYYNNGQILSINDSVIRKIEENNKNMAEKALRVIAVSYLEVEELPNDISSNTIEKNLIFVRINWNDRSTKRRRKGSSINL